MSGFSLACALAAAVHLAAPATKESIAFSVVPRQRAAFSCGYALLAGLLELRAARGGEGLPAGFPRPVTEGYLVRLYGQGRAEPAGETLPRGESENYAPTPLSIGDMRSILADFGLESAPAAINPWDISRVLESAAPIVIHYDRPAPHFVLALAAREGLVAVADPESGLAFLSIGEFAARASGYALFVSALDKKGGGAGWKTNMEDIVPRPPSPPGLAGAAARAAGQAADKAQVFSAELGFSFASRQGGEDKASWAPSLFFAGDWAFSKHIALLAKAELSWPAPFFTQLAAHAAASATAAAPEAASGSMAGPKAAPSPALRVAAGLEWHREDPAGQKSCGIAFEAAVSGGGADGTGRGSPDEDWALQPELRLRFSRAAAPFLLTGELGLSPTISLAADRSDSSGMPDSPPALRSVALNPSLSAHCLLSGLLAWKAALRQSLRFFVFDGFSVQWEGILELGMYFAAGKSLFYAGARLGVGAGEKPNSGAVFSVML